MCVPCKRQPPHHDAPGVGDEDGGVRGAADRAEVAPLVGDVPPVAVGDQPPFRLGADDAAELDEGSGIGGRRAPDREVVLSAARRDGKN
jgi:hypothetical protein